jgi:hypothetical protein
LEYREGGFSGPPRPKTTLIFPKFGLAKGANFTSLTEEYVLSCENHINGHDQFGTMAS